AEASLLHLACHGVWDADDLARSGLRLAPLPPEVPRLFGQANGSVNILALLAQLSLPRCALAVLSACESGLAKRSAADEPLSLPLAFLMAGARQVIASLWRVRDDSTLLLMGEFYRRYLEGAPAAASLAGAQRWLRALSPAAAIAALTACRADLATIPPDTLDAALLDKTRDQLDRRLTQVEQMQPDDRPYASADHWAAFVCFGAPQVASNTTNRSETGAGALSGSPSD
ncbi:MAG: CHAT domain-containing protein, partial [Chloroflexota bacterium]